jgi:hypothetical protein
VVASFRTDDETAARSGASNLHQFYITTKIGPVNVKAGDFYSTIGLGAKVCPFSLRVIDYFNFYISNFGSNANMCCAGNMPSNRSESNSTYY